MAWLELTCTLTRADAPRISNALEQIGALAVTMRDAADQPMFEPKPGETPLWDATSVTGLFEADSDAQGLIARLTTLLGNSVPLHCTTNRLEDEDWVRRSLDQFQPLRFGARLWIVPSWHTPPVADAVNVILNPGLAFGTGTHATTAMCMEWLDANDVGGCDVIDFGCGSGVLAVAAALLGARRIYAIDHDPQAIEATRANAELNGVADRIQIAEADALPDRCCDVLLANILAGPLDELAPRFATLLRSEGRIVLSGILSQQSPGLTARYQEWFTMAAAMEREEWVRLTGVRRA
jgi:ribosomal protein L11 methyltransferase